MDDLLAKVTHEASIGGIDKKKLETLMARGLTEEKSMNFVVNGLLKIVRLIGDKTWSFIIVGEIY